MTYTSLHALIDACADQTPAAAAITYDGALLTYRELQVRSQALAATLCAADAGPVALLAPRPDEWLVALLAISRSGRTAVPLAADLAPARLAHVLRDSQAALLLAGTGATAPPFAGQRIELAAAARATPDQPAWPPVAEHSPLLLSYASAETGRMEGRQITQQALLSAIQFSNSTLKLDLRSLFCLGDADVFTLALTSLSQGGVVHFAASLAELAGWLAPGAVQSLALPLDLCVAAQAELLELAAGRIAHVVTVGTTAVDGTALRAELKRRGTSWHNFFGLPEFMLVTTPRAEPGAADVRHIGKPTPFVQALVLDPAQQLVGVGIPGDLYVAGPGVVAGFPHSAEQQARAFAANPYQPTTLMYRTGYRARWQSSGRLEIVAERAGFVDADDGAVALAEIEQALCAHAQVQACAVVAAAAGVDRSYARVFVSAAERLDALELERYLAAALAPAAPSIGVIQLERLPRTAAGAVDRAALQQVTALDSQQIAMLEQGLRAIDGIGDVAIVPQLAPPPVTPLHLDDLLPSRAEHQLAPLDTVENVVLDPSGDQPRALVHGAPLVALSTAPLTLVDALERAAGSYADNAIYYYRRAGDDVRQSHAELLTAAERVLAGLRAHGVQPGGHVLFQLARNLDFVPTFWACVLGGFVPVPLSLPPTYDHASDAVARLHNAWTLLSGAVIVTSADVRPALEAAFQAHGGQPSVLEVEALRLHDPDQRHHRPQPHDPALMLLTSGSTGVPKGVVLSHHNIVARSKAEAQHNNFTSADISFNWMPLEHVGGIVMFHIRAICCACSQILAQTSDILERPVRWLDIVERYRATITWAPNFAFGLINDLHQQVNAVQRDLRSLRFILNGGEAVNVHTSMAFLRLLQSHGLPADAIHPAYGMSETSSGITSSSLLALDSATGFHELAQESLRGALRPAGPDDTAVSFVEVGAPLPGVALRIVDKHDQVLPEARIGRLQVKGETIMAGYYQNPELNAECFSADGWFTTGDLAFIKDGRLTITGREKDVIIINGLNYNSNEIETLAEEVEGLEVSYTAACAVRDPSGNTDSVVLFFCSKYAQFERQLQQSAAIKQLLANTMGLHLRYCLPVTKDLIPKTAIGKIQRTLLSRQFAAGAFAALTRQLDLATENENTLPDWFFQCRWHPEQPALVQQPAQRPVVLLSADTPLCQALQQALQAQGRQVVLVAPGSTFARHTASAYSLDCTRREDYTRLLASLAADDIAAPEFLHLLSYGAPVGLPETLDALKLAQNQGVYSVLALVQALAAAKVPATALTLATSRVQMVRPGEPLAYAQSTLIGMLKTLALELEWLACRHVDLAGADVTADASHILAELAIPRAAVEVAYRSGERLVPQLERAVFDVAAARDPFVPGGVYLITGGLGGIGAQLARWLAATYQARLILVGSSILPAAHESREGLDSRAARRLQAFEELQADGVTCIYRPVDIQNPAALRAIVDEAEALWDAPLAGVVHLAGAGNLEYHWTVMDQHWATVETTATFDLMFAPKVYGTWALQQVIQERPEVLFIGSSSVNSVFGGATFSAYSAANSFLDHALLHQRYHSHPHTTCLNWSMWDQVGMSAGNPVHMQEISRARGYRTISVRRGLQSLLVGAAQGADQLLIGLDAAAPQVRALLHAPFSYAPVLRLYTTAPVGSIMPDVLSEQIAARFGPQPITIRHVDALARTASGQVNVEALLQLERDHAPDASAGQPTNAVERQLVAIWQELLRHEQVGIHDNFFALGGHSLLATQLASRVRSAFNVELRLHQIFAAPTVARLATVIAQAQLQQIDDAELAQMFSDLDALSDAELQALLENER